MMFNPFLSNVARMVQQVKSNPVQFLAQKRLNIPQNIANDPNAILQHLVSSGQISQAQVNAAMQRMKQFGM